MYNMSLGLYVGIPVKIYLPNILAILSSDDFKHLKTG